MVHQLRPYCGLRFANTRVMIFRNVLLGTYVVTILAGGELQAQGSTLYTDGILRVKGADWQDSRLTVMPQFGDAFEIPLTSDHFKLDLGLLSTYLIRAAHEGCATKEIVFDLWVPDAYRNATFRFPFEIILEAFKANEEPYSYEQPIGAVFFDEATADFTYTTDYSSIKKARSLPALVERMQTHISLHPEPVDPLEVYGAMFAHDPNAEQPRVISSADHQSDLPAAPQDTVMAPPSMPPPMTPSPAAMATASATVTPGPRPSPPGPAPAAARVNTAASAPAAGERNNSENATSSHMATRVEVPAPEQPTGSHELNILPNMVIVIDRFANGTTSTELRKVTHAYGAVFYFQDGRSVTEHTYRQRLAEFAGTGAP